MTTWFEHPPTVTLVASTPNPLSVLYEVWCRAKDIQRVTVSPVLHGQAKIEAEMERREAELAVFERLIYDYTQIPEMVHFTWWLEGVPRAFFDQVVRHRKTSIFARSQRVRKQTGFAKNGEYLTTIPIEDDTLARAIYREAMRFSEQAYERLLERGVPVEDARGVLPLHLRTGFAWGTSLRDLAEVFRTRTCALLQQEYWAPVTRQIRELLMHTDPALGMIFLAPCQRGAGCVSEHDASLRARAVLEDGRADMHPCRIWTDEFATTSIREALHRAVAEGKTRWAKMPTDVAAADQP